MRILVYDSGQGLLSSAWWAGSFLGGFDLVFPVRSWAQARDKLRGRSFSALQIWGHGSPGSPWIADDAIPIAELADVVGPHSGGAYVWFRSCAVFAGARGHEFAADAARLLNCSVVGHTHVISLPVPTHQSGGHAIRPGETPWWTTSEGVKHDGTLKGSRPGAVNTCTIFATNPPRSWWST